MYKRKDGLYEKIISTKGKRIYFHGRTEREVFKKIKEYTEGAAKGRLFKEVSAGWEDTHFTEIAFYTVECYKKPLADVNVYFGEEHINSINPIDIQTYINEFAKGKARQTVKLRLTVLRQIFDYAVLNGELSVNPAIVIKVPKTCKTSKRELPADNDIEIIKASTALPFGLFAFLSIYTGCRRGEALALTYEDIDRDKKVIRITKAVVWENTKTVISTPKSQNGIRTVPLLKPLDKSLPKKGKGFIFGGETAMGESQFRVAWKHYCKATGIKCTPHQLRHAYATILYEAGIDSKEAKDLLGHAKESTTREIYTHIKLSRNQDTIKKLNKYIENTNTQKTRSKSDNA